MLKRIAAAYCKMFTAPTLEEIIAADMAKELETQRTTQVTIRSQQFLQHMALAKIQAMNNWLAIEANERKKQ